MPVHLTCQQCGTAFFAPPSRANRGTLFCSRACYKAAHPLRERKSPYTESRTCAYCGADFLAIPWGDTRCCSKSCARHLANGTPKERFWTQVEKTDGCWFWRPGRARNDYGRMRIPGRSSKVKAHRFSWEIHYGAIPKGMEVLHRCDTPPCVNPTHLFLGTRADNMTDKIAKNRQARGERAGLVKLTADQIPVIRALHAEGLSQHKIARRFNVTQPCIRAIINGDTWKHVP